MRDLILLRGAPGSGKSTYIAQHNLQPYTVSSDQIRLMYACPELDPQTGEPHISQRNETRIWEIMGEIVEQRMRLGQFLVIDAQNIHPDRWAKLAEKYRYHIWVKEMDTPQEECLRRNAERPPLNRVPEHVILSSFWRIGETKLSNKFKAVPDDVISGDLAPLNIDQYRKLFVVGDLHGCYEPLHALELQTNGFQESDFFVFVGDYVDRGLQNRETLELLVSLRNRENIIFLEGNHRWETLWANDQIDEIRSREFLYNTMPQLEGMDKKALREWCRRWRQLAYLEFNGKRYFITHAGVGYLPEHIRFVPAHTYTRGGDYEADVDRWWCEKNYGPNLIQIHGHRNWYSYDMDDTETSINLNSAVEFGEDLRVYCVDGKPKGAEDVVFHLYFPNTVHREGMTLRRRADIMEGKDVGTPEERTELLVLNMQAAKGVAEKQLNNNISSFNFTKDVFYSMAWDDLNKIARGLFIDTAHWKILARGYEKFFNLNEHKLFNTPDWLKEHLVFPLKCYRKYNGFLGLMSWNPYTKSLFYASKSTNEGPHAQLAKEIIEKQLTPIQLETITRYLQDNDVTLLWEILTPRDPHIIDYGGREEAVLLDIVYNTIRFKNKDFASFCTVADVVFGGVPRKQLDKEFLWWGELERSRTLETNWIQNYADGPVEGWVFSAADGYQFKVKTNYYMMWKKLRSIKEHLEKEGSGIDSNHLQDDLFRRIILYMQELHQHGWLATMSIIQVRDSWLASGGLDFPYDQ